MAAQRLHKVRAQEPPHRSGLEYRNRVLQLRMELALATFITLRESAWDWRTDLPPMGRRSSCKTAARPLGRSGSGLAAGRIRSQAHCRSASILAVPRTFRSTRIAMEVLHRSGRCLLAEGLARLVARTVYHARGCSVAVA